ncbi:MAG: hypothetical protein EAZ92_10995 [Candidatus Kapaibacterium sp.]|nr:MAG: hypothetical protein EAZ92_10995 [Candidatus Kapabacteria bacterium]
MTRFRAFFFIIALSANLSISALAQQQQQSPQQAPPVRLGAFAHGMQYFHEARFLGHLQAEYPPIPEYVRLLEPMRLTENPLSWNAGVLAEWLPMRLFAGSSLGVGVRLGVNSFATTFQSSSPFRFEGDTLLNSALRLTLQTSGIYANAEPMLLWSFADEQALIMLGGRFSTVLSETTSQTGRFFIGEKPLEGDDARKLLEPQDFSGKISSSAVFMPSVFVGASWQFPLNPQKTLLLCPEVFFTSSLGNITEYLRATSSDALPRWTATSVRIGASLKFAPEPPTPPQEQNPSNDAGSGGFASENSENTSGRGRFNNGMSNGKPTKPVAVQLLAVEGIERDGRRSFSPTLKVEEFIGSSSRYLLPFVFFDKNSAVLPERYTQFRAQDVEQFSSETLLQTTFQDNHELDAYYNMLNVVGSRMRNYASAKLTLTGYNDAAAEASNKALALQRAETIKTYLRTVWGIAPNRITTRSFGTKGNSEIVDSEENRAVEIEASQSEILDELRFDYTHRATTPPKVDFMPEITAPEGLFAWSLAVNGRGIFQADAHRQKQDSTLRLADFNGTIIPKTITWGAEKALSKLSSLKEEPLTVRLRAADTLRQSSEASVRLPVQVLSIDEKRRRNMPDVRIGTYWVFCFDLNSTQILVDERVRRAVKNIKNNITPGANVEITGFADTRGNVEKNRKLSNERAEAVLRLLNVPSSKIGNVEGRGESTLYENDLPEGRMYNRFVRVDVRTPIERK